jgi:endonuclease YncB( thermonuclease family)
LSKLKRLSKNRRPDLKAIAFALLALSAYQYFNAGKISWHREVVEQLASYLDRPDASWREASDAFNEAIPANSAPPDYDLWGRVVRVADGDTVSILDESKTQHKIRLFGIDTPERDQTYGATASRALADLISGENVGIEQKDIDDYGRTVGVIYHRGVNINVAMVAGGHAWWYRRHASSEVALESAEAEAKANKLGLWAKANPVAPWDWRRKNR